MTRIASSGRTHIGECPLRSNQCIVASGKAAIARLAFCGRHRRSLRPRPMTTRVDRVAGPSCIGPVARSFTNESNVSVSANDCSSFKTKPGSSVQGLAESCSMNEVRPVAFRVRAGSAGRKARTSVIDAVMVVRKNVRSHPCQKPPGFRATTEPARPRRAISSTSPAPKELPTMSIPVRFSLTSQSSRLRASASNVPLSSCAGACPWPGSSRTITSLAWARAGEIVSQDRRLPRQAVDEQDGFSVAKSRVKYAHAKVTRRKDLSPPRPECPHSQ